MKVALRPTAFAEPTFANLLADAEAEECLFIGRLRDHWDSGNERFDQPGEILLGAWVGENLSGIGGISLDPYAPRPGLGRLRHLYVRPALRNQGIGELLVRSLIGHGRTSFAMLRLSTQARAARLYERLGFIPEESFKQTHIMRF